MLMSKPWEKDGTVVVNASGQIVEATLCPCNYKYDSCAFTIDQYSYQYDSCSWDITPE